MVEEVETQLVAAADAMQSGVGGGVGFVEGLGAQVGQFGGFQVAPDQFHRVEVVGVAGQRLDAQPVSLGGQPRLHVLGAVRGQPVPDQDDRLAAQVPAQLGEVFDEAFGV